MANYNWAKQVAWAPGAWSAGAWDAGAFAPGAWQLLGPACSVQPALTGSLTQGSTLTCSQGSWSSGNGAISYAYQWTRNNAKIAGATAATYVIAGADNGCRLACVVTATDTNGSSMRTSNVVAPSF